jgi:hypothetical protein
VATGAFPETKHLVPMDPVEYEKFLEEIERL